MTNSGVHAVIDQMDDGTYKRLVDEVVAAGGRLELTAAELSKRLEGSVDVRDSYGQHIVRRQLEALGLTAQFQIDGRLSLKTQPSTVRRATQSKKAITASAVPDDQAVTAKKPARAPKLASTPLDSASDARPKASPAAKPRPVSTAAQDPTPPAAHLDDSSEGSSVTSQQVGNGLYALLVFICTFFPAIGHQLAPGGEVGEKQDAFFAIYFATFPLSLAATFIWLTFLCEWFDNDKERLGAAGVAIVVSAAWGIGFGMNYADISTISQLQGPPLMVIAGVVFLALGAYAAFYGWPLFIAGVLSSLFAALWIKEKSRNLDNLFS